MYSKARDQPLTPRAMCVVDLRIPNNFQLLQGRSSNGASQQADSSAVGSQSPAPRLRAVEATKDGALLHLKEHQSNKPTVVQVQLTSFQGRRKYSSRERYGRLHSAGPTVNFQEPRPHPSQKPRARQDSVVRRAWSDSTSPCRFFVSFHDSWKMIEASASVGGPRKKKKERWLVQKKKACALSTRNASNRARRE